MTNCYIFSVSEAPKEPAAAKKFVSYDPKYKTDQQKKEEVRISWISLNKKDTYIHGYTSNKFLFEICVFITSFSVKYVFIHYFKFFFVMI